jgi:hypothetical protein
VITILSLDFGNVVEMVDPRVTRRKLAVIASLARNEWVRLAKQQVGKSSRDDYVRGIQPVEATDRGGYVITLAGTLPNLIERGWDARDLRKVFLRGPKVKVSAGGHRYRVIFFRAMVSDLTPGEYTRAKRLRSTVRKGPRGRIGYGERLSDPTPRKPHHATGLRDNMYRFEAGYSAGVRQAHYGTFRTITSNPAAERGNWRHPGIRPHSIAPQVHKYIARIAPRIMGGR